MSRKCLMFGLLLLVLGTVLGMALQWHPTTPPTAAPRDGQGATVDPAHPAEGDFRRTGSSSQPGGAGGSPPGETDRVAVPSDTPAAEPASLLVHVVARPAEGEVVGVPWTDVVLELDDDATTRRIARTDREGNASFDLDAAAGRQVRVASGVGGFVEAKLQPNEQRLELTITPRAIAIGKVIDRAGRGVADADLVLLRWSDSGDDGPLYRIGRSDPEGLFRIPVAVGGRLGAIAPLHAPSALHLLRAAPAGRVLQQTFELVLFGDAATVRGVVVDGDGRPVAGARIGIDSLEARPAGSERAAPPQRFTADAHGEFVAAGLTPGLLAISAWADDYGWTRDELRVGSDQAFVTLRLPWPSRVVGIVETGDGTPVADARVVASAGSPWLQVGTRTDRTGRFTLGGLGSGPVQLRATSNGQSVRAELDLEPGSSREWRAVLGSETTGPMLRGVVLGADERPRADWRVVVGAKGVLPRSTFTGEDGSFAVAVPTAALLDVRVFAAGRQVAGFADALVRGVDAAAGPLRIVIDAAPPATVRASIAAADGGPLPAKVAAWHHERREYAQFTAAADGVLVIPQVPAGNLDLSVEHSGYARSELRDRTVTAGAELDLGQVLLERAGSLYGTVRGPGGSIPEACELKISVDGQVVNGDYQGGSYRFAGLPAGNHRLRVQGPGLGAAAFAIEVRAGEDLERNLELELGLRRRVVVVAPEGARGDVHLALERGDHVVQWLATASLQSQPGGPPQATFLVHMTGGSYRAVAWMDRSVAAEREVEFRFDDEPDVTMVLR